MTDTSLVDHISRNPKFQELERRRSVFSWTLTAIMLAIYYGFILVVAFWPKLLGIPIAQGMVTTWGFPVGVGVILSAVVLTGIYVWRANTEFDRLTREIIQEAR